jgi:hypothetical protein
MSIFKNIKQFIANRALKLELQDVQKDKKPNKFKFDKAKTVGILFDATNAEDYEIVKRYVVYLREHQKRIKVIGYFSTKQIPTLTYSKLEYDFFSVKELNWLGKPTSPVIQNFINEEYDLLIDLNIHDHFALKYISALSKAAFKVGKYDENNIETFDMMIDADNTKTVKYFLRQIDTYITMLNKVEPTLN